MKLFFLFKKEILKQFTRFCIVGLFSATTTYLIFVIFLHFFKIHYLLSATIGIFFGVLFGFGFNHAFTFRSPKKILLTMPRYFLVYFISWSFNMVGLKFLVDVKGPDPIISNLLLLPIIVAINFFGAKFFAFQDKKW